ncbi:hypothetical protein HGA91_00190 [candidate division WWE3 bacterium]|nr:hypothetical protein [candidate division WWE3 bacterium]
MSKIDYKKLLAEFYAPSSKEVEIITLPVWNYIMIDGMGDPNTSPQAKSAIETLFPVAYKIKFHIKKTRQIDFGVMPLEGLWWADNMNDFTSGKKEKWKWTYMIMQPDVVTHDDYLETIDQVSADKKLDISKLRFESFDEGVAAQIMHLGPFSEEGPTIKKVHEFITELGSEFNGHKQKHHEIYLSDIRRVAPEKMKTIIRQPFLIAA